MKDGIKSSEFYIAATGIAGIAWSFAQQNCDLSTEKVLGLAGVVVAYIIGRSWVKAKK